MKALKGLPVGKKDLGRLVRVRFPEPLLRDLVREAQATRIRPNALLIRKLIDASHQPYLGKGNKRVAGRTFGYEMLRLLSFGAILFLLPACSGIPSTMIYDVAGVGAGAGLGAAISHGNPYATVAGGVGGVAASELLQSASKNNSMAQYGRGYDRGKSDAIKEDYWAKERMLAPNPTSEQSSLSYLPVPVDEGTDTPIKHVPRTVGVPVID